MSPPEVDSQEDVADGTVPGVKNAAVRKLCHELGIPASQLPVGNFKFLTRLHYWAADTVTHGKDRYVFLSFGLLLIQPLLEILIFSQRFFLQSLGRTRNRLRAILCCTKQMSCYD